MQEEKRPKGIFYFFCLSLQEEENIKKSGGSQTASVTFASKIYFEWKGNLSSHWIVRLTQLITESVSKTKNAMRERHLVIRHQKTHNSLANSSAKNASRYWPQIAHLVWMSWNIYLLPKLSINRWTGSGSKKKSFSGKTKGWILSVRRSITKKWGSITNF